MGSPLKWVRVSGVCVCMCFTNRGRRGQSMRSHCLLPGQGSLHRKDVWMKGEAQSYCHLPHVNLWATHCLGCFVWPAQPGDLVEVSRGSNVLPLSEWQQRFGRQVWVWTFPLSTSLSLTWCKDSKSLWRPSSEPLWEVIVRTPLVSVLERGPECRDGTACEGGGDRWWEERRDSAPVTCGCTLCAIIAACIRTWPVTGCVLQDNPVVYLLPTTAYLQERNSETLSQYQLARTVWGLKHGWKEIDSVLGTDWAFNKCRPISESWGHSHHWTKTKSNQVCSASLAPSR
jgi:hypothetical protein